MKRKVRIKQQIQKAFAKKLHANSRNRHLKRRKSACTGQPRLVGEKQPAGPTLTDLPYKIDGVYTRVRLGKRVIT